MIRIYIKLTPAINYYLITKKVYNINFACK